MFNSNVNSFSNNTMTKNEKLDFLEIFLKHIPNTFVNNNTNSMSSYVKNTTGFTMIESMWHTFLYGTITLKRNNKKNDFVVEISLTLTSTMSPRL